MSVLNLIQTKLKEGLFILREEGLLALIYAGLRLMNLNHQGINYYLNYHYKRIIVRDQQMADPFTVLYIDPQKINHITGNVDKWEQMGEVQAGEWDRREKNLKNSVTYRSTYNRFRHGTPWEDTDLYQRTVEQVENGISSWNGCRTRNQIEQRVKQVEQLYETIRNDGFKSQSELQNKSIKSLLLSRKFERSKSDVTVAIGREGEFLFVDGRHRLAIAHALDLEKIPVRIVVRHSNWQQIRETIRSAPSVDSLPKRVKTHANHPDVDSAVVNNINF